MARLLLVKKETRAMNVAVENFILLCRIGLNV
jgi:hypothetical protein